MTEEVKSQPVESAPWNLPWTQVAKQSGVEIPHEKPTKSTVEAVSDKVKPWLMSWGVIASKAQPSTPKSVPFRVPDQVNVSTEAKMKIAAVIQPHERMPDTESDANNISNIDKEIEIAKKNKLPKSAIDALLNERLKFTKGVMR